MTDVVETIKLREFDLDQIPPSTKNFKDHKQSGSAVMCIGKRGTGKSTIIASILYGKRHIFPTGMFISGTEDLNHFYEKIVPSTFIFNKYEETQIEKFIQRQKIAKQHVENPWAALVVDDCMDNPAIFRTPLQRFLFKNGRHASTCYIVGNQYALSIMPEIRTNIDIIFLLREPSLRNRKIMYENYASIIPDFKLFCTIMDQITNDYTALVIDNVNKSNDWRDCVFWYKAPPVPPDFKFGCPEYWSFHYARYNPEYVDPVLV